MPQQPKTEAMAFMGTRVRAGDGKAKPFSINSSGYFISRIAYPLKYKLPVTDNVCYTSGTFDENLHEHISLDLADGVGRGSDTS